MLEMRPASIAVTAIAVGAFALWPGAAFAVPTLQLDIVGGVYDETTETIVAPSGDELTLVALLTPHKKDEAELLLTEYFLSAALLPAVEEASDLGSFSIQMGEDEAQTFDATGDMAFGAPPHEPLQAFDAHDLSRHGIFETYFAEFGFTFDPDQQAASYDTQDTPGGDLDITGTGSFYQLFTIDASLLAEGLDLHFDLYSTKFVGGGGSGMLTGTGLEDELDRDLFAPFSHDAETHTNGMPEPATFALVGLGGLLLAMRRRRS
jgi:hypothetical protein